MTDRGTRNHFFCVGERASLAKTVTEKEARTLAELTGDTDSSQLGDGEEHARETGLGRLMVHGMFSGGLISAVLGTRLPGPGATYLSQQIEFLAPVYVGDTITATVEVVAWRPEKRIVTLRTDCHNQDHKQVVTGQAVLMVPAPH